MRSVLEITQILVTVSAPIAMSLAVATAPVMAQSGIASSSSATELTSRAAEAAIQGNSEPPTGWDAVEATLMHDRPSDPNQPQELSITEKVLAGTPLHEPKPALTEAGKQEVSKAGFDPLANVTQMLDFSGQTASQKATGIALRPADALNPDNAPDPFMILLGVAVLLVLGSSALFLKSES